MTIALIATKRVVRNLERGTAIMSLGEGSVPLSRVSASLFYGVVAIH
jgi:hypothetical protein